MFANVRQCSVMSRIKRFGKTNPTSQGRPQSRQSEPSLFIRLEPNRRNYRGLRVLYSARPWVVMSDVAAREMIDSRAVVPEAAPNPRLHMMDLPAPVAPI